MADYKCPVCGHTVPRDLLVFLDHTNQHIMDKLKERYPHWVTTDGLCPKCVEHLQKLSSK